ncbi:MAG TPA: hypothetical protein VI318_06230 [Baekduia sp.]
MIVHVIVYVGQATLSVPFVPAVQETVPAVGRPVTGHVGPQPDGLTLEQEPNVNEVRFSATLVPLAPPLDVDRKLAVDDWQVCNGVGKPPDVVAASDPVSLIAMFVPLGYTLAVGHAPVAGTLHSLVADAEPAPTARVSISTDKAITKVLA